MCMTVVYAHDSCVILCECVSKAIVSIKCGIISWNEEGYRDGRLKETAYRLYMFFGVALLIYPPDYARVDKPQHHDKRCNNVYYRLLGGSVSFPGNTAASARFPVHRPYTGPFTSVLREMAASSSCFFRVFWLVLPIVSVFDRALDEFWRVETNPRVREKVSHYEGKKPITGNGGRWVGAASGSLGSLRSPYLS